MTVLSPSSINIQGSVMFMGIFMVLRTLGLSLFRSMKVMLLRLILIMEYILFVLDIVKGVSHDAPYNVSVMVHRVLSKHSRLRLYKFDI